MFSWDEALRKERTREGGKADPTVCFPPRALPPGDCTAAAPLLCSTDTLGVKHANSPISGNPIKKSQADRNSCQWGGRGWPLRSELHRGLGIPTYFTD